jgi:hypothetical protein
MLEYKREAELIRHLRTWLVTSSTTLYLEDRVPIIPCPKVLLGYDKIFEKDGGQMFSWIKVEIS